MGRVFYKAPWEVFPLMESSPEKPQQPFESQILLYPNKKQKEKQ